MHPYYAMRAAGGALVVLGAITMLINIIITIRKASREQAPAQAATA
jgi:cytochrome c oxidase cbb3-type subunit 1